MKKLIIFIFMFIMALGIVSAFEFDNRIKDYDEDKREYLIKNAFGLGEDIAKVKLTSDLNQMVARGYQKVAEFQVENYGDYVNVFNKMEFYDLNKNSESFVRDFDYKYKTTIQVPSYKYVCDKGLNENGTISDICRTEQTGLRDKIVWEEINKADGLFKGNITIGIFTHVEKGDVIEWIPTLFGERLTQWAVWTEALNVDLVACYKLDGLSGDVIDSQGDNNGTNSGATRGATGILNFSFDFESDDSDFVNLTDMDELSGVDEFSVSLWVNPEVMQTTDVLITQGTSTEIDSAFLLRVFASGLVDLIIWNTGGTPSQINNLVVVAGEWSHIVASYNGTNTTLYVNNTISAIGVLTGNIRNSPQNVTLGSWNNNVNFYDGLMDEVFIWNRSLSSSEVSDLFNNATAITCTNAFAPILTLNSPVDAFNTTSQTINFNGTVTRGDTIGILNVTLFIDGVANETNSSRINDTDYLFTKTISVGSHNWTYESCDTNADCTTATTRTFTILNFLINQFTFNASSFETAQEGFTVNITTNGSAPTSAKLIYNGTTFSSATVTNTFGNDFNITRTIDIPLVNGTKSFHFNFTLNSAEFNTTTQTQIINATNFTICQASPLNIPFINITFRNETLAEENVNATISSTWTYSLTALSGINKTLSFTDAVQKLNYTFCFAPSDRTVNIDLTMTYNNDISQQRSFLLTTTLSNTTLT
ncbi:hypothetical protein LCGC14_1176100, partial [marine sediment metagenome]